jgi:hypothetical protein
MNKYGMNLVELAQEIMRRAESKKDFVAETSKLVFENDALLVGDAGAFPLTDHAHGQIAERVGIPKRYYDRMRADAPDLLAGNVNHWFRERPERRMVRTLDGKARAFLSDRYHRIDNERIAEAVLPVLLEGGGHGAVVSCCVTDSKLYLQALFPRLEGEVRRGDPVQGGVIVSNGEIGDGALDVRPMIYRLCCTNGLIAGQVAEDARLRRNHVGRRVEIGEDYSVYSDETLKADDRALSLKIRDSIRALAQPQLFARILAELRDAAQQPPVGNPIAAVSELGKSYPIAQGERDSILMNLIRGADYSKWGMVNAITETANDHPSYDRAVELQTMGGRVLELKPKQWGAIAAARPAEIELADL